LKTIASPLPLAARLELICQVLEALVETCEVDEL
jgi:hypothetical protein